MSNKYIIRAWDYDTVFGYLSKMTDESFEISDSCYAIKFNRKRDAQDVIEVLKKTPFSKLQFRIVKVLDN